MPLAMTAEEIQKIFMETGLLYYADPSKHWFLHETIAGLFTGMSQAYYDMGREDFLREQSTPCGHC